MVSCNVEGDPPGVKRTTPVFQLTVLSWLRDHCFFKTVSLAHQHNPQLWFRKKNKKENHGRPTPADQAPITSLVNVA